MYKQQILHQNQDSISSSQFNQNNNEFLIQQSLLQKFNQQLANTFTNKQSSTSKLQQENNPHYQQQLFSQQQFNTSSPVLNSPQIQNNLQPTSFHLKLQSLDNSSNLMQNSNTTYTTKATNQDNNSQVQQMQQSKQMKLFSTNLQSFGNLPLSVSSQGSGSHQSSLKSLSHANKSQVILDSHIRLEQMIQQDKNDMNSMNKMIQQQQSPLLIPFNNQSFANIPQVQQNSNNARTNNSSNMKLINKSPLQIENETIENTEQSNIFQQKQNDKEDKKKNIISVVSLQTIGQLKQIYNELTLYPSHDELRQELNSRNSEKKQKFIKSLRNTMEGLLKVLIWRIDNVITPGEFSQIYQEWLKTRGELDKQILNSSSISHLDSDLQQEINESTSFKEPFLDEQKWFIKTISTYFKDTQSLEQNLPTLIDIFNKKLNIYILSPNISLNLGFDSIGKQISCISSEWVIEVEQLFKLLDDEQLSSVNSDRLQYFLMALLLNEIKSHNREDMIILVQKQISAIQDHMYHVYGHVSLRNFKQYMLIQRLRREAEIVTLKNNLKRIQKYWFKAKRSSKLIEKEYPVMRLYLSKYPQSLLQSIVMALNDKNFSIFTLEINQSGFYQSNLFDSQLTKADKNNLQLLKIARFFLDQFFEIGTKFNFLDGTQVPLEKVEAFADKLFKKFISNSQEGESGEVMGVVIQNINTFQNIFAQAISNYRTINNLAISEIIDQHLLLETESSFQQNQQNTSIDNNSHPNQIGYTKESNQIDSYQTQTSPPRKPHHPTTTSSNRLIEEAQILGQLDDKAYDQQQLIFQPPQYQQQKVISSRQSKRNESKNVSAIKVNKNSQERQKIQEENSQKTLPTFSLNLSKLSKGQIDEEGIIPSYNKNERKISNQNQQHKTGTSPYQNKKNGKNNLRGSSLPDSGRSSTSIKYVSASQKSPIFLNEQLNQNPHETPIILDQINFQNHLHNANSYDSKSSSSQEANIYTDDAPIYSNQNKQTPLIMVTAQNKTLPITPIKQQQPQMITPSKVSLRQQIELQQQIIQQSRSKQNQSKQQNLFMYNQANLQQYSSHKNQIDESAKNNFGIQNHQFLRQQNQSQNNSFKVICQTPLSSVPHISNNKDKNKRDRTNSFMSQNINNNIQNSKSNTLIGARSAAGSVTSRGAISNKSQSTVSNNMQNSNHGSLIQRRSGQQPVQNLASSRAKTPTLINQNIDNKIVLSSINQKIDINQPQIIKQNIQVPYNQQFFAVEQAQKKLQETKSPRLQGLNQSLSNQKGLGSYQPERSPIGGRSRRVENYEEVISRLMQLSVSSLGNAKR